jgi:three-Cys-motif partner protein
MTWLDNQIKKLEGTESQFSDEIKIIANTKPDILNDFTEATPLKLIFLNYSLSIYSSIIFKHVKTKKFFESMYYVDLFSGSGLNKLRTKNDILIGSPFIAVLNHRKKFTKFIFCEQNSKYKEALDLRLKKIKVDNYAILPGNCNQIIDGIVHEIENSKKAHSFFFIDPYAMEFHWRSMVKVLKTYSDILFTFMTNSVNRAREAAFASPQKKTPALNNFFGDDSWKNPSKDVVEIYKSNILKIRPRGLIESIKIDTYYDLIFITNKTKGENKWMKGIIQAKKEIESNSKRAVQISLDKIKRGQKDLEQILIPNKKNEIGRSKKEG